MTCDRCKPQEPHEVDAFQWDGGAHTANTTFGDRYGIDWEYLSQGSSDLLLPAERYGETMTARIGDWVVHTPLGGFSVFTPEQFAASYEPVPGTEAENKLLSLCDDGELLDQLVERFRARSPHDGGPCLITHINLWGYFTLGNLDHAPLKAYVAGTMPGYVFADWIEENVRDFPAEALALLREPAEVK